MVASNSVSYPPDIHMHTHYCGHASGKIEAMVQKAIELGMPVMGFSEHFYYPESYEEPMPNCVIAKHHFPNYLSDIQTLQEKYRDQIDILLGAEVDYLSGLMDVQKKNLSQWPLDYIIGSIHMIDDMMIDYSEEDLTANLKVLGGVQILWERYWSTMEDLISCDICDIVGHLDLPRKFTPGIIDPSHYMDRVVVIIDSMVEKGLVMDINTGGIVRSAQKEIYPAQEILKYASQKQVEISLGSDAHQPVDVGRFFEETSQYLQSFGWEKVTYFKKRERFYFPLA